MDTHIMAKAAKIHGVAPEQQAQPNTAKRQSARHNSVKAELLKAVAEGEMRSDSKPLKPIKTRRECAYNFLSEYSEDILECFEHDVIKASRFEDACAIAIASDPELIKAISTAAPYLAGAIMQAALLGLEPNTALGLCFLCPYLAKDGDVLKPKVSFQLGYQGAINLIRKNGNGCYVNAEVVKENDFFDYELGTSPFIKHKPCDEQRGQSTRYYAIYKEHGSDMPLFKVWTRQEVFEHAKQYSRMWNDATQSFAGAWKNNFDAMAKKTVILDCLKYAPKSTALSEVLAADNTTKAYVRNGEIKPTEVVSRMRGEDFNEEMESPAITIGYKGDDPAKKSAAIREAFNLKSGADITRQS